MKKFYPYFENTKLLDKSKYCIMNAKNINDYCYSLYANCRFSFQHNNRKSIHLQIDACVFLKVDCRIHLTSTGHLCAIYYSLADTSFNLHRFSYNLKNMLPLILENVVC